ncbi:hypothetical protein CC1G_15362 [Coprinopsis cinerea okayama7|uniref:Uncharacterized protein n=1 Tax=Coprinopsis cinerea (strain Okayama-7 / 130 / ATCC MYA-4618 / FGSC 9003) TaxID=240176 RepID=D6RQ41_COPC7|nr:hypothetical protein CC1G_15362 [Coprinopsis cinerea okayama7\|eukprot:XP_002910455.1 hypothetical protein CC1G_15362 [Coprinopsis cinerea okayama7\
MHTSHRIVQFAQPLASAYSTTPTLVKPYIDSSVDAVVRRPTEHHPIAHLAISIAISISIAVVIDSSFLRPTTHLEVFNFRGGNATNGQRQHANPYIRPGPDFRGDTFPAHRGPDDAQAGFIASY